MTDFVSQSHALQENHVDVFSKHVANKLKKICARGAKGKVLTNAEILRAKVNIYMLKVLLTVDNGIFVGSTI